ncbi:hypothetical protein [Acinetobacter gandensis]|uniref:hypothetical protein n=1 Tax=Acinetobacter gandensis TaxID=1443941 RepID=UPI003F54F18D
MKFVQGTLVLTLATILTACGGGGSDGATLIIMIILMEIMTMAVVQQRHLQTQPKHNWIF